MGWAYSNAVLLISDKGVLEMKIYLAGPLFTEAERLWHLQFKKELEESGHTVIWPGELIDDEDIAVWGDDAQRNIMITDRDALMSCDTVVALIDGTQVDDGTAWEIGYAYANNIPVYGIRTDFRNAGETKRGVVNAMIEGSLKELFRSRDEAIRGLSM